MYDFKQHLVKGMKNINLRIKIKRNIFIQGIDAFFVGINSLR